MAKMKRLLTDIEEYKDEIDELVERVENVLPDATKLLAVNSLTDEDRRVFLRYFSNDEELIGLTLVSLELETSLNEM